VPTARLELAQLSPLPPQDSVSTNFTTSAVNLTLSLFPSLCSSTMSTRTALPVRQDQR
jgi:hypothetical protein